jgi:tripartite-type tricarboxylate transporter receptor subunit TctC
MRRQRVIMPHARLEHFQVALKSAVVMAAVVPAILFAAATDPAQGEPGFPSHPITMVVPLPAGGTADLLCRIAAEKAGSILNQQIVVENRAGGAGGRVGTESVLRSPPDGYTLLCAPQLTYSITHLVFAKAAWNRSACSRPIR